MNTRQMLIDDEGVRRSAYTDSRGYLTIGVGRLIDGRKGGGLRDSEIGLLLDNDIADAQQSLFAALPWARSINEPRQAVLIGMAFQLGLDGLLQFKKALAAMQAADWDEAERQMLDSDWRRQTPVRAAKRARQMRTGEWQA